ncbi:transcription factor grauzone-like [Topomyia yanbarensis]|uniref:transcription factor grauzone-like n=1 Tax=Topomyia yanbarensis TaxID=2498891 RepID=UPI00273BCDFF|nr:transcription factor grauzone-like [Topomyia yanbarensis]
MSQIDEKSPDSCYVCLEHATDLIRIVEDIDDVMKESESNAETQSRSYRGTIIAKYFWFEIEDLVRSFICSRCWTKIEKFHEFYCEVEKTHENKCQFSFAPVKQEETANETETSFDEVERLEESSDGVDFGTLLHVQVNPVNANDNAQKKKQRKRYRPKRMKLADRIAQDDELIAKYVNASCDQCSAHFPSFTELQTHSTAIHQRRAYVFCCDKRYNQRTRLFEHILLHVNPEHYQCDVCKRNCLDNESLRRHKMKIHTPDEERAFKCDKCPKAFVTEADFGLHQNYHLAMENKKFKCEECEKCFGNKSLLKSHVRNAHASHFEFVCDTCAKGFNQRSLFVRHLQDHNPKATIERSQCPLCSLWMKKNYLNKHMQRHSSPRTRCELCGKDSPNVFAHRSHMRFAHSEAKFTCNVCGKAFKRALTLKEHLASHSGAVLYTCPHCPKTFNSNANMHSHRKKMHYEEWLANKERVLIKKE